MRFSLTFAGTRIPGRVSVIHCVQAVAPHMQERGYGKIINVSSLAALGTAVDGTTAYAAIKAGVGILTKRMAYEFGPAGILVNCVAPGFILTDMNQAGDPAEVEPRLEKMREKTLLKRNGEPEEIAYTILFLASDEASFTTGQIFAVDGGRVDFLSHSA